MKENHIHHLLTPYIETDNMEEIMTVYSEDVSMYEDSLFYAVLDANSIVGSVKITRWNGTTMLPIQKLFGIDVHQFTATKGIGSIWHVGRFAIARKQGALLLKQLLTVAISTMCKDQNCIMVAECDRKFVKVLNMVGIQTQQLAPSVFYLGSETLPIYSSYEWLSNFLHQNVPSFSMSMEKN
ncbi:MAG: hypothetical protein QM610_04820 [Chitinophagaceae bacterium]